MRCTLLVALAFALAPCLFAQTTGVPGLNDYTINGMGSGASSCNAVSVSVPGLITFLIDTSAPAQTVYLFISFQACAAGSGPSLNSCQGTTLDLALTPTPLLLGVGLSGSSRLYGLSFSLPPFSSPVRFSTQGLIVDSGCGGSPLFTQAHDVTLL